METDRSDAADRGELDLPSRNGRDQSITGTGR